jgi:hypothetical protein
MKMRKYHTLKTAIVLCLCAPALALTAPAAPASAQANTVVGLENLKAGANGLTTQANAFAANFKGVKVLCAPQYDALKAQLDAWAQAASAISNARRTGVRQYIAANGRTYTSSAGVDGNPISNLANSAAAVNAVAAAQAVLKRIKRDPCLPNRRVAGLPPTEIPVGGALYVGTEAASEGYAVAIAPTRPFASSQGSVSFQRPVPVLPSSVAANRVSLAPPTIGSSSLIVAQSGSARFAPVLLPNQAAPFENQAALLGGGN